MFQIHLNSSSLHIGQYKKRERERKLPAKKGVESIRNSSKIVVKLRKIIVKTRIIEHRNKNR